MAYTKTGYYHDTSGVIHERESGYSTHYYLEGDVIYSNSGSTHYYLGGSEEDTDRKILTPGGGSSGFMWGSDGYIYGPSSDSIPPWME